MVEKISVTVPQSTKWSLHIADTFFFFTCGWSNDLSPSSTAEHTDGVSCWRACRLWGLAVFCSGLVFSHHEGDSGCVLGPRPDMMSCAWRGYIHLAGPGSVLILSLYCTLTLRRSTATSLNAWQNQSEILQVQKVPFYAARRGTVSNYIICKASY